jgi:hypothetical protein|tara:strand:+ start:329 stop:562 length:234 start_codon:yes stop_codon:yes gene_type:complete
MTKNENGFGTLFEGEIDVAEERPKDKLKSGECRDKIIRKILKMELTSADLAWLAEGLMDIVSEMDDAGIDYSNEVKI